MPKISTANPSFFLIKSEPDKFSIDDLCKSKTTPWDGVRNFEARNKMKSMKLNDKCLFYHSNAKPPGIVGIAEVSTEAYPDYTALEKDGDHFDPKHTLDNPRWFMVDVSYLQHFKRMVTLKEIQAKDEFKEMELVKRGRLSVQSVSKEHFNSIVEMGEL